MSRYFVTTTIYYVNDVPHVGHAYTTLAGDITARYWKQKIGKNNVFFLTGTDEHGQKMARSAKEKGLTPKKFVDSVVPRFKDAWKLLDIEYDHFIRTTDPRHERVAQRLLQKIYDGGFIYPGEYEGLYCVGCEKFLTKTDLVDGLCPLHPKEKPIHQKEKNYFLKLKDLAEKEVLPRIEKGEYKILPLKRKNEIVSRIKQGVEDISISREGVSWGIPVPWDKKQTIYVWVEALMNYFSATQFVKGKKSFWPADVHLIGKDIVWFHSVIWQALLIAAGEKLPKTIFAHGFFTVEGQKISKSLKNTIPPKELVDLFGVDGTRYILFAEIPFGSDANLSIRRFKERYQADLANGLGNLVSRVAKLCEMDNAEGIKEFSSDQQLLRSSLKKGGFYNHMETFKFSLALEELWREMHGLDKKIERDRPWDKSSEERRGYLKSYAKRLLSLAKELQPFLPETAKKIMSQFKGPKINAQTPLFPRL